MVESWMILPISGEKLVPAGSPIIPRNLCLLFMAWASTHASLAGLSHAQIATAQPPHSAAAGDQSVAEKQDDSPAPTLATSEAISSQEAAASSQDAAETEELPPARTEYMGREIAVTMHFTGAPWLVRDSREREEDCSTMLAQLQIKPGMTVCDMGCGNGFYTLELAKLVGSKGQVLAVDIQPEMLRMLEARAKENDLSNIQPILGTLTDPRLPENAVDIILCVDVYHEFSHPEYMLAAMRKALKPAGRLVLVEFRAEDPAVPIKPLHKMSKHQINKELLANDFVLAREFDDLPWQHMMFFKKR